MKKIFQHHFVVSFTLFLCAFLPASGLNAQADYWDGVHTDKEYFDSLYTAQSETFTAHFEISFVAILEEEERKEYSAITSIPARKEYIERYWKKANPNPMLLQNDRLLDFIERRTYVIEHYPLDRPPYHDDRGTYFLKYGEPTDRFTDGGGRKSVRFFMDTMMYQYMAALYRGFPPPREYLVYANETWIYRNISADFIIHFVKKGSGYKEVNSITEALQTGIGKNAAWYWSDMFKERAHLAPTMNRTAVELERYENELRNSALFGRSSLSSTDLYIPDKQIRTQKIQYESELAFEKTDPPGSIYYPVQARNEVPIFSDVAQFRDTNNKTRLEVALLSPLTEHYDNSIAVDTLNFVNIRYEGILRDLNFDQLAKSQSSVIIPAEMLEYNSLPNGVGMISISALPQQGDITFQVYNTNNGKTGYVHDTLSVRDFSGDDLMLSDVQYFKRIESQDDQRIYHTVIRQDTELIPYPFVEIDCTKPLICYFEIYNLLNTVVSKKYIVEFKVITHTRSKSVIKKIARFFRGSSNVSLSTTHERIVSGDTSVEQYAIDLSELPSGAYQLEISVTDSKNKSVTARISKPLILAR